MIFILEHEGKPAGALRIEERQAAFLLNESAFFNHAHDIDDFEALIKQGHVGIDAGIANESPTDQAAAASESSRRRV